MKITISSVFVWICIVKKFYVYPEYYKGIYSSRVNMKLLSIITLAVAFPTLMCASIEDRELSSNGILKSPSERQDLGAAAAAGAAIINSWSTMVQALAAAFTQQAGTAQQGAGAAAQQGAGAAAQQGAGAVQQGAGAAQQGAGGAQQGAGAAVQQRAGQIPQGRIFTAPNII